MSTATIGQRSKRKTQIGFVSSRSGDKGGSRPASRASGVLAADARRASGNGTSIPGLGLPVRLLAIASISAKV